MCGYTCLFIRKKTCIISNLCDDHSSGHSSKTYKSFQLVWKDRTHRGNNIKPGNMCNNAWSETVMYLCPLEVQKRSRPEAEIERGLTG